MSEFSNLLARARVAAATGRWPPDLGRLVVVALSELAPVAERVEARNAILRRAAALVSGSRWAKARRLEAEMRGASRPGRRETSTGGDEVAALVAAAIGPSEVLSMRTLVRILEQEGSDTEPAAAPHLDVSLPGRRTLAG